MRALIADRYGTPDTLRLAELPVPVPGPDELLIRVEATTVNRTDTATLAAHPFFARAATGLIRPNFPVFGLEFSGVVEEVGETASGFSPGDAVFGLSPGRFGTHAEFFCLPAHGAVVLKPASVPHLEAIVCEGAWYANGSVGALERGHEALIYGASGAIGIAALQIAKGRGARVTAVVGPRHVELARSLGADAVVDYTAEDFTALDRRFDLVFDAVGHTSYGQCRRLLIPGGIYRATDLGPGWSNIPLSLWSALTGTRRVGIPFPQDAPGFVRAMAGWLEAGAFRGVFDRVYPFDEIAEAYRYVAMGEKTGIVAVDMRPGAERTYLFDR